MKRNPRWLNRAFVLSAAGGSVIASGRPASATNAESQNDHTTSVVQKRHDYFLDPSTKSIVISDALPYRAWKSVLADRDLDPDDLETWCRFLQKSPRYYTNMRIHLGIPREFIGTDTSSQPHGEEESFTTEWEEEAPMLMEYADIVVLLQPYNARPLPDVRGVVRFSQKAKANVSTRQLPQIIEVIADEELELL